MNSIREFRELTEIKIKSKQSGLFMVVEVYLRISFRILLYVQNYLEKIDMHKYAVQITVADTRDGACSSSTLKEASSWGKVDLSKEQMVFAEATSVLPLIASDAFHKEIWKKENENFQNLFNK